MGLFCCVALFRARMLGLTRVQFILKQCFLKPKTSDRGTQDASGALALILRELSSVWEGRSSAPCLRDRCAGCRCPIQRASWMSHKQALCRQLRTCSPWKQEDRRAGPLWMQGPVQGLAAPVVRPHTALLAVADTLAGGHLQSICCCGHLGLEPLIEYITVMSLGPSHTAHQALFHDRILCFGQGEIACSAHAWQDGQAHRAGPARGAVLWQREGSPALRQGQWRGAHVSIPRWTRSHERQGPRARKRATA